LNRKTDGAGVFTGFGGSGDQAWPDFPVPVVRVFGRGLLAVPLGLALGFRLS
jgi:hypothetical protein